MRTTHDVHLTKLAELLAGGEFGKPEEIGLVGFSNLTYEERDRRAEVLMKELEVHKGDHRPFLNELNRLISHARAQLSGLREAMRLAELQLSAQPMPVSG